jgi:hypothetical protein
LKKGDIINWPKEIPLVWLSKHSYKRLKLLHRLREEFYVSKEFQKALNNPRVTHTSLKSEFHKTHYRDELRSDVRKYLGDKLATKLNVPSIKVPWSQMTAKDIINWPADVKFIKVQKMNKDELKSLHKLAKEDLLDFSPEFISRFEDMTADRDELRSVVAKYIGDKLAKKLNVSSMQVPWSQMTAEDIINWPQDIEFRSISQINTNELKRLHKLVKGYVLDFSPEFLKRQLAKSKSAAPELH